MTRLPWEIQEDNTFKTKNGLDFCQKKASLQDSRTFLLKFDECRMFAESESFDGQGQVIPIAGGTPKNMIDLTTWKTTEANSYVVIVCRQDMRERGTKA